MAESSQKNANRRPDPNAALVRMLAGFLVVSFLIGALLFGAAGRFDWILGWIFLLVWSIPKFIFTFLLRWSDPDLLVERVTRHANTQRYDRLILPIYFVMAFGTILVGALDGGRFQWSSEIALALIILGYVIYLSGNLLAAWAVNSNPFFSSESRLQTDRNQQVTRRGPYQFVRHPGYLATILLWPVVGLTLGSWWAVIPGVLAAVSMLIRTVYEDKMLHANLPGYAEYAGHVRYRLFPGVW